MSETFELKVGKRGEIYTTREIRERLGLKSGEKVVARVEGDKLILQPKPIALGSLEIPKTSMKALTPEELAESRLIWPFSGGGSL